MTDSSHGSHELLLALSALGVLALLSASPIYGAAVFDPTSSSLPIKHVVVIVEENHTFDNYFGTYPGANGLSGASKLPATVGGRPSVAPFHINGVTLTSDLCHSAECGRRAYDNGKMDGFIIADGGSNLTMGYFDYNQIPYYWDYASQFVLLDNFYSSVMAPSLPNHLYLVAGQSGGLTGSSTSGFINYTSSLVHNSTFYFKPIADELNSRNVSWRYYAGGYQGLNNWNPLPAFSEFKNSPSLMQNLADTPTFAADVKAGRLPDVSWLMPGTDLESEHPPYNVSTGEHLVVSEINTLMQSGYWNSTAIFLTFDDYGGWYDHVPPPQVDSLGYGFRVPCMVISPYAKQGAVDHVQQDFASILKFVETLYSLQPLSTRDASAGTMMEAFNFTQSPRPPLVLPGRYMPDHYPLVLAPIQSTTTSTVSTTSSATSPTTTSTTSTTKASTSATAKAESEAQTSGAYLVPSAVVGAFVVGTLMVTFMRRRTRINPPGSTL